VSGDNERQIRDRLGGALDTITPASAPVGSVIRKGRGIRNRRRAGVAAGLAVVIGLGAALPSIVRHSPAPPQPVGPPHYRITVRPPAKGAPAGLIATGAINGKKWSVTLLRSGGGSTVAQIPGYSYYNVGGSPDGNPAYLTQNSDQVRASAVGTVARNVTRLTLQMANGTLLDLHPVAYRGQRWVAVMLPARLPVLDVVAYSGSGEIAHAIPFNNGGVVGWLKPGQQGPARATMKFASGTADGQRWSAYAYVGPWGRCFQTGNSDGCFPGLASLVRKGQLLSMGGCDPRARNNATFYQLNAALSVRSVLVRMSDGAAARLRPVAVGGSGAFGFLVAGSARFKSWTAYGASGQQLGTGRGWDCGEPG
jgi:hypothetical protein